MSPPYSSAAETQEANGQPGVTPPQTPIPNDLGEVLSALADGLDQVLTDAPVASSPEDEPAARMPAPNAPLTDRVLDTAVSDAGPLTAHEAAEFLHISPATLRAWEQQFGFPASLRPGDRAPGYPMTELLVLQDALSSALSITSAIRTARRQIADTP